jgi:Pyridine nucleotide-disulphide oxidoreductase, dimerisation domain
MQANQVQYRSVFLSRCAPAQRPAGCRVHRTGGRPCGLSEAEAHQRGIAVRVATLPMAAVLRARMSETRGFMKAVVDVDNDSILGFAMLGAKSER